MISSQALARFVCSGVFTDLVGESFKVFQELSRRGP